MRSHHTQIKLNRLGARDVREMIAQVTASNALTEQTVATVVESTGGVPLFVNELKRTVLEERPIFDSGSDWRTHVKWLNQCPVRGRKAAGSPCAGETAIAARHGQKRNAGLEGS
jgi:hypothetical protein